MSVLFQKMFPNYSEASKIRMKYGFSEEIMLPMSTITENCGNVRQRAETRHRANTTVLLAAG